MSKDRDDARERKRARFDESAGSNKNAGRGVAIGAAVVAVALAAGGLYWWSKKNDGAAPVSGGDRHAPPPAPASPGAPAEPSAVAAIAPDGDVYRVPLANVTAEASYFKASVGDGSVTFFAVRDAKGEHHVALDACQVCAHAKKGYAQKGQVMQCRNCGMTFPVADITKNAGTGG